MARKTYTVITTEILPNAIPQFAAMQPAVDRVDAYERLVQIRDTYVDAGFFWFKYGNTYTVRHGRTNQVFILSVESY